MAVAEIFVFISLFAFSLGTVDWDTFKDHHDKRYANPREEAFRKQIFLTNKQLIEEHNVRYSSEKETYSMAMNQFGDLTEKEFKEKVLCLSLKPGHARNASRLATDNDPPSSADWREKGAVTEVKNQGNCGSCWAFSTTGSLESQLFLKTGKLVPLSEQNLVDCSQSFGNTGCYGGLMENSFQYIQQNGGIDTEESYPYEGKDNGCRFKKEAVATTISGYAKVPAGDEKALQNAVGGVGPVSVAIDASGSFQFYEKGVYYNKNCSPALNHGVLTVGYGTEGGQDFWLVKNSWGKTWGDQGYIKMARNKSNNCGIATLASYPTLK